MGDLTLIVDSWLRSLQRVGRERTNCESCQSSIGFPRNGLTKAATASRSLAKSLCKGFCFTFLPVRGLAYPLASCRMNREETVKLLPNTTSLYTLNSLQALFYMLYSLCHYVSVKITFANMYSPAVSSCLWRPNSTCCTIT